MPILTPNPSPAYLHPSQSSSLLYPYHLLTLPPSSPLLHLSQSHPFPTLPSLFWSLPFLPKPIFNPLITPNVSPSTPYPPFLPLLPPHPYHPTSTSSSSLTPVPAYPIPILTFPDPNPPLCITFLSHPLPTYNSTYPSLPITPPDPYPLPFLPLPLTYPIPLNTLYGQKILWSIWDHHGQLVFLT